ncbi:MAG: polyphosphate kinase 1 [Saprospiraceae bacterium]
MQELPYLKRDISWLDFNHRVLQEAQDQRVPLYERIKFLAIYSSNLDEFFRVRVAALRSFKELKKKTRRVLELKPKKELREIRQIVQAQQQQFGRIFRHEILPELRRQGIYLLDAQAYTQAQHAFARQYFTEQIKPLLKPVFLKEEHDAPFLENAALYFVVQFQHTDALAIVNIPSNHLPRFIILPDSGDQYHITFLDDIIKANLHLIFEQPVAAAYAIKLSRDAELDLADEYQGDLLEKIKKSLKKRHIGLPTRFLFDSEMPQELLERLKILFNITKNDLIPGARYHNFNDFFTFPNPLKDSNLHDIPLPPLSHPDLEQAESLLTAIQHKDHLLHFPYHKFDYVTRLIAEAALDAQVRSIRMTLYRIASASAIVEALLKACKSGKNVVVFIEAKARFDEENNLQWGARLEKAGAKVHYSQPGIKVHSKLLLISRETEGQLQHYAYIGTGNFNEKTARLYTDHALLTADQRLSAEVLQVFDYLEDSTESTFHHLLVSPFTLRERFVAMIDQEIANVEAGKPAFIRLKMNSLEDKDMIRKLYEASQAGVMVQLIVRGICCLRAGWMGWSENIEVISIVDRFLEHARIYWFANGGAEVLYIASADWMTRNLDRRIEVATPIYNPQLFNELCNIFLLQWKDNTKARRIDAEQMNAFKESNGMEETVHAQLDIYQWLKQN